MKKLIALALCLAMVLSLAACAKQETSAPKEAFTAETVQRVSYEEVIGEAPKSVAVDTAGVDYSAMKIGFIHVSDPSDMGYTYNHDRGTQKMAETLGIGADQIINKYNIAENDSDVMAACQELVEDGCNIVFGTSFGFENAMIEAAKAYPEVEFCHATGYQASIVNLPNFHNYFGSIFETRYLSGIVAGLKAKQLGNNVLGYVAAVPFAEVISGFTAFYLGAKSVNPDVTMKVMYTGSWNDPTKEAQNAQALVDAGCSVISQHCDSTAPATVAESAGIFHVGYNSGMIDVAPNASLGSCTWDWSQYLVYAVTSCAKGEAISTDWSAGCAEGVCLLSDLNESLIAEGTVEAVRTAYQGLVGGTLHVFAGPLTGEGVDFSGNPVTIEVAEGDYYHESEEVSAPSWNYIIPGVEVIE